MGVDLKLLVTHGNRQANAGIAFAHTMIELERRSDLWEPIGDVESEKAYPLSSYVARDADGESCYGRIEKDCYGADIRWVEAGALAKLHDNANVTNNPTNRAAWAFLRELPPDTMIALYWH